MDDNTAEMKAAETNADHQEALHDVVRVIEGKGLTPMVMVSVLLLAAIHIMNKYILPAAPQRRGKLINTMTPEWRRLLQTYLRN
jgi:hypothetical protein